MLSGLTDTHCHLNLPEYSGDLEAVLSRARAVGVSHIVVPGFDLDSSRIAVELAAANEDIHAAIGVHPHYADGWDDRALRELRGMARSAPVVAIGEIGLDFHRDYAPRQAQREVFQAQLELALDLCLPVIIHQRESMAEILDTLLQYDGETPPELHGRRGVLHAYSSGGKFASIAVEKGFYLGVAGPITFRKADPLRAVIGNAPLERLLTETDSPYLSPEPIRGKRNEPAHVRHIVDQLANLCGTSPENILQVTSENAENIFRWCNESSDSNLS
jgi:TatD DNase family protein